MTGFSWHDLRHYAASILIEAGASVNAVQRHLAHRSATTTLDVDPTGAALEAGLNSVSPACYDSAVEAR